MKLIGTHASPFTRKARVVAIEKRIDLQFEIDNPWQTATQVIAANPLGKVPALILEDNATLFDSRVIVEFLDGASPVSRLIPQANRARATVKRWEAIADGVLDAAIAIRLEGQRAEGLRNSAWIERQWGKVQRSIDEMERDFGTDAFVTGTNLSLADIAIGVCLFWLAFRFPEFDWRKSHPLLTKLAQKLDERPSFAETRPRE
ncbi:MAG: glutathione S-transferase [Betaproteobacteria bacterium]|nr:glutathione S-transferase [Betaproteobacteria bacterium]